MARDEPRGIEGTSAPPHIQEGPQNTRERIDETQNGTHVPDSVLIDALRTRLATATDEDRATLRRLLGLE
jgi:hypothetical protein